MISVIAPLQELPEAFSATLKALQSHFGSRVQVSRDINPPDQFPDKTKVTILFLPPNWKGWDHLIPRKNSQRQHAGMIACVESTSQAEISKLLDAEIDDVFILPRSEDALLQKVRRLVDPSRSESIEEMKSEVLTKHGAMSNFIGGSRVFIEAIQAIPLMSKVDSSVLITGESGTGKELCARAIHYLGIRADKPFIPVNCGAIPENLFENELFGHERGAYTDAFSSQRGLLAEVHGGTLFLDEVDSLTKSAQVKLLRFLEEGWFKPLGAVKPLHSDVRFVCATNVDLQHEVREHNFREDLFYRINVLNIDLPPLRSRKNDISLLAAHFLEKFAAQYNKGALYFSKRALQTLINQKWLGNIRELKNVIERSVVMSVSSIIHPSDLSIESPHLTHLPLTKTFWEEKEVLLQNFGRDYLEIVLNENSWNVSRAANQAQIDRRSFQRMMKKHGLDRCGKIPAPAAG